MSAPLERPWRDRIAHLPIPGVLALLCLGQVLLWAMAFGLTYSAPEVDSAEQFVWAYSLENGYWKHPPLPSWILHALIRIFGTSVALPFVATQVCVVVALALVWRLGCEFMSPSRALIAAALTSLVTYHNLGADCFNHSTVLLPFQAATVLFFYLASRRDACFLWLLTGLFGGLSMLVKYVAVIPIAGLLLYFLLDSRLHTRTKMRGLCAAACVAALVLTPHVLWLSSTGFLPFRYAQSVTQPLPGLQATLSSLAEFTWMQVARTLPFLIAVAIVLWPRGAAVVSSQRLPLPPTDRLFLWVTATVPLAGTLLVGLISGTELQTRWGSNGFLLVGLLPFALLRPRETAAMLRRAVAVVAAFQVTLCLGMTLAKTVLAERLDIRTRANFPGAVLAERAQHTWRLHADVPLRLVVSDIWLGGNVIANTPRRVAVLIDGRNFKSPWVSEGAVDSCGALVLDDLTPDKAGREVPNPALDRLMQRAEVTGTWLLPWARPELHAGASDRGVVRWGIVKPMPGAQCTLR